MRHSYLCEAPYSQARPRPLYHIQKVTRAQPIGSKAAAGQIMTIQLCRAVLDEELVMEGQK